MGGHVRKALILCVCFAASGCGLHSAEQIADTNCRNFGATPGTQGYLQCRMQQQAEQHQANMQRAAMLSSLGDSFKPTPMDPEIIRALTTTPPLPANPVVNHEIHCTTQTYVPGRADTTCR